MLNLPKILAPDNPEFPPVSEALADPNGLLAVGGELSTAYLIKAYRQGIFPWFNPGEPILWWSPDPRAVLFPQNLIVSHSLRKLLAKKAFTMTIDQDSMAVVYSYL